MNNKEAEELSLALSSEIKRLLMRHHGEPIRDVIPIVKGKLSTLLTAKLYETRSDCTKCLKIQVTTKQEDPTAIDVTLSRDIVNICPSCPIR